METAVAVLPATDNPESLASLESVAPVGRPFVMEDVRPAVVAAADTMVVAAEAAADITAAAAEAPAEDRRSSNRAHLVLECIEARKTMRVTAT